MTIKELYEIAVSNDMENAKIEIQYRDDGGCYNGTDLEVYCEFDKETNTVIL